MSHDITLERRLPGVTQGPGALLQLSAAEAVLLGLGLEAWLLGHLLCEEMLCWLPDLGEVICPPL